MNFNFQAIATTVLTILIIPVVSAIPVDIVYSRGRFFSLFGFVPLLYSTPLISCSFIKLVLDLSFSLLIGGRPVQRSPVEAWLWMDASWNLHG